MQKRFHIGKMINYFFFNKKYQKATTPAGVASGNRKVTSMSKPKVTKNAIADTPTITRTNRILAPKNFQNPKIEINIRIAMMYSI